MASNINIFPLVVLVRIVQVFEEGKRSTEAPTVTECIHCFESDTSISRGGSTCIEHMLAILSSPRSTIIQLSPVKRNSWREAVNVTNDVLFRF